MSLAMLLGLTPYVPPVALNIHPHIQVEKTRQSGTKISRESKIDRIRKALEDGCCSIIDIASQAGCSVSTARTNLIYLIGKGEVKQVDSFRVNVKVTRYYLKE